MARRRRPLPEINAGSMADIAFLLLIFFLVTTNMDTDTVMKSKLPPWNPDEQVDQNIKHKNILILELLAGDTLKVEGQAAPLNSLKQQVKDFVSNNGDGTCSYCEGLNDPASSDNPRKAIIYINPDSVSTYNAYIGIQNEIREAYRELREEYSQKYFGKKLSELNTKEYNTVVNEIFPLRISEAEPGKEED